MNLFQRKRRRKSHEFERNNSFPDCSDEMMISLSFSGMERKTNVNRKRIRRCESVQMRLINVCSTRIHAHKHAYAHWASSQIRLCTCWRWSTTRSALSTPNGSAHNINEKKYFVIIYFLTLNTMRCAGDEQPRNLSLST